LHSFTQRIALILLLIGPIEHSIAEDEPTVEQGETVWIEEKIQPSTRWLEGLVKPMTSWMEGKIQKRQNDAQQSPQIVEKTPQAVNTDLTFTSKDGVIDTQRIAQIARQAVPGQVLRVKLLQRSPLQYRVKLISTEGEIRMLYIHAHNGKILQGIDSASTE
jgi:uncharacterized membrane protein YkoI